MKSLLLFIPAILSAQSLSIGALPFAASGGGGGSVPTGYAHCKVITVSSSMVSGGSDLSNYPLTVNLAADNDLKVGGGGYVNSTSGYDIGFYTACSGAASPLTWEMESYTSGTGALTAHVLMPTLHTAGDTIGMAFGGSQSTFQSTASSVWTSNYQGVWHLPSTLTGDSTSNARTLTNQGGMSASTGQVDGSAVGTGSSTSYFKTSSTTLLVSGDYTISAWVKTAGGNYATNADWGVGQWANSGGFKGYQIYAAGSGVFRVYVNTSHYDSTAAIPNDGAWHQIVGVNSGGTGLVYVDGVSNTGSIGASTPTSPSEAVAIGTYAATSNPQSKINGDIDEVRISNTAISAGWLITEFRNQSTSGCSGSPCLTVGVLQ
jgi:hypothetical protein